METDGEEATWTVVAPRRKRRWPGPTPKTSPVGEGAGEDSFFALSGGDENNNGDDNNGNGNNNEIGKSNDNVNSGDEKGDNNNPQTRKESDTDKEEDR